MTPTLHAEQALPAIRGRGHDRAWSHHAADGAALGGPALDDRAVETNAVRARRPRRPRGQAGSVLVEAALIMPILMLLTFGIIEFGMAFGNASTVADASRAGARLAATGYAGAAVQSTYVVTIGTAVKSELTALNNGVPLEMWVYKGNTGQPATCTATTNCWDLVWSTSTKTWGTPTGGWTPDACGTTIDSVGVWVKVQSNFVTGYFGKNKVITYHTIVRLEPLPSDQCTTGS